MTVFVLPDGAAENLGPEVQRLEELVLPGGGVRVRQFADRSESVGAAGRLLRDLGVRRPDGSAELGDRERKTATIVEFNGGAARALARRDRPGRTTIVEATAQTGASANFRRLFADVAWRHGPTWTPMLLAQVLVLAGAAAGLLSVGGGSAPGAVAWGLTLGGLVWLLISVAVGSSWARIGFFSPLSLRALGAGMLGCWPSLLALVTAEWALKAPKTALVLAGTGLAAVVLLLVALGTVLGRPARPQPSAESAIPGYRLGADGVLRQGVTPAAPGAAPVIRRGIPWAVALLLPPAVGLAGYTVLVAAPGEALSPLRAAELAEPRVFLAAALLAIATVWLALGQFIARLQREAHLEGAPPHQREMAWRMLLTAATSGWAVSPLALAGAGLGPEVLWLAYIFVALNGLLFIGGLLKWIGGRQSGGG